MGMHMQCSCDSCEDDITITGNCEDWRIRLESEMIPSKGGALTLLHVYPPIASSKYFCSLKCLREWVVNNV